MSSTQFVNVASLVPNQRRCNLRLRVLSVETIAETMDPETGRIIQSAEAIVGDETACILLNLKNDQVNLLARNARLQLLNAHVNMYRGFMRLEVMEEDEENHDTSDGSQEKASITAILDDEDADGPIDQNDQDGDPTTATTLATPQNRSESSSSFSTEARSSSIPAVATVSSETSPAVAASASSAVTSPPTASPGLLASSSTTAVSSIALSASTLPSSSRDQMEVEMRLGTGGSVSLMEYYRTMEYTYFSTVEPVGR
ncbi:hypothetical protein EC968_009916 [Mortierella alpina]|nr:hypothetical protein EC968_009916 [Mortierella alpina]